MQLPLFELPPESDSQLAAEASLLRSLDASACNWSSRPPGADPGMLDTLRSQAPLTLPESYLTLLAFSNGPAGPLGIRPGWFQIWPAEQVLELNKGYGVPDCIPGFFGFGGNGGGELFAFKIQSKQPHPIVMIPYVTMDEREAIVIAPSFGELINFMGVERNVE